MSHMTKFCRGPLEYGKKYALDMEWGGMMAPNPEQFKPRGGNAYDVRGANRVIWFCVDPSPSFPNAGAVKLSRTYKEGYLPTYFLPWSEDQIYRIALKPSRVTNDEEYFRQKLLDLENERGLAEDTSGFDERIEAVQTARDTLAGVEVDYFFTAPVDGCTVYIEGDSDAPWVYHANAKNHGPSPFDATSMREFREFMTAKSDEMARYYEAFQQHAPKLPGHLGNTKRALGQEHYVGKRAKPGLFPGETEKELKEIARGIAEVGNKVVALGDKLQITKRVGTIFGKRVKGEWEFYAQNRLEVRHVVSDYKRAVAKQGYIRYGLSWINPVDYYSWWYQSSRVEQFSLSMQCEPFWPDGIGRWM